MTMKYYSGQTEVKNIFPLKVSRFAAIGGERSKHNRYDSFSRIVGHPVSGPDAILPITRSIQYKSNPSLHKCDARCMNATGHICECSCGGLNHGAGN